MIFYLYKRSDGRVVLDSAMPDGASLIRSIEAERWKEARANVDADLEFARDDGRGGYFSDEEAA